jgi:hypothetical protein
MSYEFHSLMRLLTSPDCLLPIAYRLSPRILYIFEDIPVKVNNPSPNFS